MSMEAKYCQYCRHYRLDRMDGPHCVKGPRVMPISPLTQKDCFEEKVEEPEQDPVQEPAPAPATKVCTKCGRELPVTEFNRNRRMKDGRQSECRECIAKLGKVSRKKLNERKREEKQQEVQRQMEAGVKVCKKCGRTLPLSAFGRGHAADGLQAICKECKSEQGRLANARRREKEADKIRQEAAQKAPDPEPPKTAPMEFEFECAIQGFEVKVPIPGGLVELRLVAAQEDVAAVGMLALAGKILTVKLTVK